MASTDKDFIVAIELGSSRIAGIVGKKKDGTMNVLAYAEENTPGCIKRGIVFNVEKTYQSINNIISKLENTLKIKIKKAYVGIGGQSVRSYKCIIKRNMLTQSYITNEAIDQMKDESLEIPFQDYDVLENFPQEYIVDQSTVLEPVGVMGTNIEGEFLNVIARTKLKANIETCFASTTIDIAEELLAPYQLAKNVLTDNEKRSGCVLIDLGAETTTVVVYMKNIIRHLVTIPLGSNNINQDLMNLQIDDNEAEEIKQKFGISIIEDTNNEEQETKTYTTSDGRSIEVNNIQNIIDARLSEIIDNVRYQIEKSDYETKLLAGIVLTGGGSNMKNIDKIFLNSISKVDKIRIAKTINQPIIKSSNASRLIVDNGRNNTLLSLLLAGTIYCGGDTFEGGTLFDKEEQEKEKEKQAAIAKAEADAELKTVNTLEEIKKKLREGYDKVTKAKIEIEKNGKDKKVRNAAADVAAEANNIVGEDYDNCIKVLGGKGQYKQTLKEAADILSKLKEEVEDLEKKIEEARKANSLSSKFKRFLDDIVNDSEA